MPADAMARLHGTMRTPMAPAPIAPAPGTSPGDEDYAWRTLLNPGTDAPPERAVAEVNGVTIAKGSRVVLRPTGAPIRWNVPGGTRGARRGRVPDIEGRAYVAVVLDDDPAGALHAELGRFFYYGMEKSSTVPPAGHVAI